MLPKANSLPYKIPKICIRKYNETNKCLAPYNTVSSVILTDSRPIFFEE